MASSQADTVGSSSKAKPLETNGAGFRPQVNMTVEPPKQGDLQKSYASIVGDDYAPKGWYGSMSMCSDYRRRVQMMITD